MSHAAIQKRSEARFWDSEQWRVDWERWSLENCSVIEDRNIVSHLRRNLLCSVHRESEPIIDSQLQDSSLDAYTIHQFLLVQLDEILRNSFSSILQFWENLLRGFQGRVYSNFRSLDANLSSLFEPDQPIDLLDVAQIVGISIRAISEFLFPMFDLHVCFRFEQSRLSQLFSSNG